MKSPSPAVRRVVLGSIAIFPLAMLTVLVWAVNRTHPYIGPFPFLLFWIVAWVFLTPFFMAVVYVLDHRWQRADEDAGGRDDLRGGETGVR